MYDWAVSAVQTTIMAAVFPLYFVEIAKLDLPESRATQAIATANTVVAIVLAVLSPVLGAVSDYVAAKKRMLGASMVVGVAAVAGMFFVQQGRLPHGAGAFCHFPDRRYSQHCVLRCAVASYRVGG
jgi:UMF1 family MFS transporter